MDTRVKKGEKINKELKLREKQEKKEKRRKRRRKVFIIFILLLGIFLIYSRYVEPSMLFVNEHKLTSNEISDSFHGIKIVHFSDLHYGSTIDEDNIGKVVNKINGLKPDIVVFTGDLFFESYEMSSDDIKVLSDALNKINSKLGKYAIYGNHDYYRDDFLEVLNKTDFKLLVNDYDVIYNNDNNPILIYGVDDILYGNPILDKLNDDKIKDIDYRIVLAHEGDYVDEILNYDVDLILSGHSHNGQINIPYLVSLCLPDGAKEYYKPYYKVNNTDIYISNGIGTSIFKLRFGSIPSINLYRLNKEK